MKYDNARLEGGWMLLIIGLLERRKIKTNIIYDQNYNKIYNKHNNQIYN